MQLGWIVHLVSECGVSRTVAVDSNGGGARSILYDLDDLHDVPRLGQGRVAQLGPQIEFREALAQWRSAEQSRATQSVSIDSYQWHGLRQLPPTQPR